MISLIKSHDDFAFWMPVLFPILQGHPHGGLDGRGTIVREENFVQSLAGGEGGKFRCELHGRRMREAKE